MKQKFLRFWLTALVMLVSTVGYAYDFESNGIYYNITSLQNLTLEVTSGDQKYTNEVVIPEYVTYAGRTFNVKTLGSSAFSGCSQMTQLVLPNTITEAGSYAFKGCSALTSLTIPASMTEIKPGAFTGCYKLSTLILEDSSTSIKLWEKEYQVNNYSTFLDCPLQYVYIGRDISVGSYDYHAKFYNKSKLTTIVFGPNVTKVGDFVGCSNLEEITIPTNVTTISYYAFRFCSKLKTVNLNRGLKNIYYNAFEGCTSLESITIPNSVVHLGTDCFKDCTKLKTVYTRSVTPPSISESSFPGIVYLSAILFVPTGSKELYESAKGWQDFASIVETDDLVDKVQWNYEKINNYWHDNPTTHASEVRLCPDLTQVGGPYICNLAGRAFTGEMTFSYMENSNEELTNYSNGHFVFVEHPEETARYVNVVLPNGAIVEYQITPSEEGTRLFAQSSSTPQTVVATITPSGVIQLVNNEVSQILLNAYDCDELAYGQTLCARIGYEIECNNGPIKIVDGDFDVRFLKPLKVVQTPLYLTPDDLSSGMAKTKLTSCIKLYNGKSFAEYPEYMETFATYFDIENPLNWITNYDSDYFDKTIRDTCLKDKFEVDNGKGIIVFINESNQNSCFSVLVPIKIWHAWSSYAPIQSAITIVVTNHYPTQKEIKGDINGDGKLTIADVNQLIDLLLHQ